MLFSSITFLYYFLPMVLILYFLTPKKGRNIVLLISSLFFYAWPEWRGMWRNDYLLLLIGASFSAWAFGFLIERWRGSPRAKLALVTSVTVNLLLLGIFKYADFFIVTINRLVFGANQPDEYVIGVLGLALPIGISFYTFQILSYSIDLYRGSVKLQKNYFKFATYVSLFPQLIAGPIVRYATVEKELNQRSVTMQDFGEGATRFAVGLGKKVLIANIFGELCQFYTSAAQVSVLFTWLYAISFSLQIYFDFSGYSDMAIGLGRLFGFRFNENFNYPYISKSVTEFWRRWHMSLGSWFRDYVYIPMGGNRVGHARYILNIFVVWLLTGFWHGAGFNFIIWGLYFAALLLLERFVLKKLFDRLPSVLTWMFMLFAVIISWLFFDSPTLSLAITRIGHLFGAGGIGLTDPVGLYYLRSYTVPLLVAIVAATPLPKLCYTKLIGSQMGSRIAVVLQPLLVLALLLLCTGYLVDGSFNPFIYFRF